MRVNPERPQGVVEVEDDHFGQWQAVVEAQRDGGFICKDGGWCAAGGGLGGLGAWWCGALFGHCGSEEKGEEDCDGEDKEDKGVDFVKRDGCGL